MRYKKAKPENDWLIDTDPRDGSKWMVNSTVGNLPKKIIKKVAKYHATKGKTKL